MKLESWNLLQFVQNDLITFLDISRDKYGIEFPNVLAHLEYIFSNYEPTGITLQAGFGLTKCNRNSLSVEMKLKSEAPTDWYDLLDAVAEFKTLSDIYYDIYIYLNAQPYPIFVVSHVSERKPNTLLPDPYRVLGFLDKYQRFVI